MGPNKRFSGKWVGVNKISLMECNTQSKKIDNSKNIVAIAKVFWIPITPILKSNQAEGLEITTWIRKQKGPYSFMC